MKKIKHLPNKDGLYGKYGGQQIPPQLKGIFDEIASEYKKAMKDNNIPMFTEAKVLDIKNNAVDVMVNNNKEFSRGIIYE